MARERTQIVYLVQYHILQLPAPALWEARTCHLHLELVALGHAFLPLLRQEYAPTPVWDQTDPTQPSSRHLGQTRADHPSLSRQVAHLSLRNGKLSQWNDISKRIFFETGGKYYKTSKQCREHWFNHLDKSKKKGEWTKSEDLLLLETVKNEGRKWSTITHLLG